MGSSEYYLSCAKAREINIIGYLAGLGFKPEKIRGNGYWYKSPLRIEGTASFKVNSGLNRWYDFGIGRGGNIIDFGILFHNCSVSDFLAMLTAPTSHNPPYQLHSFTPVPPSAGIKIIEASELRSKALIRCLNDRGISYTIAAAYCVEIRYQVEGRKYYGIGFWNDSKGYEIRSAYFKGSLSPKDITTIRFGNDTISVFEGFIDFLSFLQLFPQPEIPRTDFLILNSLAFFHKSRSLMNTYPQVDLYLDNDPAGKSIAMQACGGSKIYSDKSGLYKDFKDLNEFLINHTNANGGIPLFQSIPP